MKANFSFWAHFCYVLRIATMISLCTSTKAIAQGFEPDHYLSYHIKAMPFSTESISLSDKFIDWTEFIASNAFKLFNPALKIHDGNEFAAQYPDLHYAAYKLVDAESITINQAIHVSNQFGEFDIDQLNPNYLLLPTRDGYLHGRAENDAVTQVADHYLCYDIPEQIIEAVDGVVSDIFQTREFSTIKATRLCTPTAKIHDGNQYDIINDVNSNHLMCFEIEKRRLFKIMLFFNQFGAQKALVSRDSEICLPSTLTITPDVCGDSAPDDNGICGGICENPGDVCQTSEDGQSCGCVTPPPPACKDTAPDDNGVCGGTCPNAGDVCEASADGTTCGCVTPPPPACKDAGPDESGVCGGTCPNAGDTCETSADGTTCGCVPQPPSCGDIGPDDNGICGGVCATVGDVCQAISGGPDADGAYCGCVTPSPPACGDTGPDDMGVCGGVCPNAGDVCQIISGGPNADGGYCGCVTPPPSHLDMDPFEPLSH